MNTTTTLETITTACTYLGASPFRDEYSDPKHDCQRNLGGRSHYVDDQTLRWHKSRILYSGIIPNTGAMLYFIIESVNSRPAHGGENKRLVVFDVFGMVLTNCDDWHRTSEKARRAMGEFLTGFDLVGHYLGEIERRAARMRETAEKALQAIA